MSDNHAPIPIVLENGVRQVIRGAAPVQAIDPVPLPPDAYFIKGIIF